MTPDELDELASEYVLGTLGPEQRLHVQQRLEHDAPLRAAVDAWEQRLLPLTELAEPVAPSPSLWRRIERSLGHHTVDAAPSVPWWNLLALWRGLAGAGLLASLILAALLLSRPGAVNPTAYVVVLMAPQSQAPGWVIQASNDQQILSLIHI